MMNRKTITMALLVLLGLGSATFFQNCAKNSFSQQPDEISQSSTGEIAEESAEVLDPSVAPTVTTVPAVTVTTVTPTPTEIVEMEKCLGRVLASSELVTCSDVPAGKTAYCNLKSQSAYLRMISGSYDQESITISKVEGTAKAIDEFGVGDFLAVGKVTMTRTQLNSVSCVYVQMITTPKSAVGKTFYIQLENLTSGKLEKILLTIRSSN